MNKLLLSLVAIATLSLSSFGQAPEGFKYQAVVRDAGNIILNNQAVGMQMTIQQGSIGGTTVYQETFATTTNAYGLVNLEIGNGTVVSGIFTSIDWANGPYFIETAVDVTGGTSYVVMGTSQLMSVPYSLHANTAVNVINDQVDDADADPNNELQDISLTGTDLSITNGSTLDLSVIQDGVNDADADPNNELQDISLTGTDLSITNGSTLDLSVIQDGVNDADPDPNNEIQSISRSGTTVTLSNGGGTFEDSVGVYTAGAGIDITSNVISTTSACGLSIGDNYQGGIIFYLDASGCHGLICATSDQSAGIQWYNGSNVNTYAYGSGIYDGFGNSMAILNWQGFCSSCNALGVAFSANNGYNDWYLPSIGELRLMFENVGPGNALGLGNVGGFTNVEYWSSSEASDTQALSYVFFNPPSNFSGAALKTNTFRVRQVRAF